MSESESESESKLELESELESESNNEETPGLQLGKKTYEILSIFRKPMPSADILEPGDNANLDQTIEEYKPIYILLIKVMVWTAFGNIPNAMGYDQILLEIFDDKEVLYNYIQKHFHFSNILCIGSDIEDIIKNCCIVERIPKNENFIRAVAIETYALWLSYNLQYKTIIDVIVYSNVTFSAIFDNNSEKIIKNFQEDKNFRGKHSIKNKLTNYRNKPDDCCVDTITEVAIEYPKMGRCDGGFECIRRTLYFAENICVNTGSISCELK